MATRVTIAERNRRHRKGNLYDVNLELTLPGPDVVVSRTAPLHSEDEDLATALGEAFEKARRALLELRATRRGEVKAHEEPNAGRVTDLFPDYGFILGTDGRVVYFHRNSVAHDAWDALEVGSQVRFLDEPGDKGPHATTVTVLKAEKAPTGRPVET
jgi:cold shock CspA family protein